MSGQGSQRQANQSDHLRGKDDRTASDDYQGHSRPDEARTGEPPGIQATHAGIPTHDPAPRQIDDTGTGSEAIPQYDREQPPDHRFKGAGKDSEGAFGQEESPTPPR